MSAAELSRLTAALVAEIHWHSLEARRCRDAAEELERSSGYEDEAWLNTEAAARHTETAERLHAILYPPADNEEEILPF